MQSLPLQPSGPRNFSEAWETPSDAMELCPDALTDAVIDPNDEVDMDWEDPDSRIFNTAENFRRELSHRPSSPYECSEQTRSRLNFKYARTTQTKDSPRC